MSEKVKIINDFYGRLNASQFKAVLKSFIEAAASNGDKTFIEYCATHLPAFIAYSELSERARVMVTSFNPRIKPKEILNNTGIISHERDEVLAQLITAHDEIADLKQTIRALENTSSAEIANLKRENGVLNDRWNHSARECAHLKEKLTEITKVLNVTK